MVVVVGFRETEGMNEIVAFSEHGPDRPTILLVDDAFLMRSVLAEILEDNGLHAVPAASDEEAIAHLRSPEQIDLVFSDLKAPGESGFALARWIHENRPDIPVILAGGYYAGKTGTAAQSCGAAFLHRPCNFDSIVASIREALARKPAIPA
jgi:DNA-binding NtrC family response regulator